MARMRKYLPNPAISDRSTRKLTPGFLATIIGFPFLEKNLGP